MQATFGLVRLALLIRGCWLCARMKSLSQLGLIEANLVSTAGPVRNGLPQASPKVQDATQALGRVTEAVGFGLRHVCRSLFWVRQFLQEDYVVCEFALSCV